MPHPPLLKPYSDLAPYNVIVVELDDEPRIRFVGNLLSGPEGAINEIDPNTIRIGEPVEVVFKRFVRADGSEEAVPMRACAAAQGSHHHPNQARELAKPPNPGGCGHGAAPLKWGGQADDRQGG